MTIEVTLQGIDGNLRATGTHDSIELGPITAGRLQEIFATLLPQTPPDSDDPCPMGVFVNAGGDVLSFMIDGGRIIESETGRAVSVEDAVKWATAFSRRNEPKHDVHSTKPARQGRGKPAQSKGYKVDWEGVGLGCGFGILCFAIGALVLYAVLTGGDAQETESASRATSASYQLVRMMPSSIKDWLAGIFAVLMLLGSLFFGVLGISALIPKKR